MPVMEFTDTQKETLVLLLFEELSYKEAAERMNVKPKTVDTRKQRALKKLREVLEDLYEEDE